MTRFRAGWLVYSEVGGESDSGEYKGIWGIKSYINKKEASISECFDLLIK
jgi:hypothetical protein